MSCRIGVLAVNQPKNARPVEFIDQEAVKFLLEVGLVQFISKRVVRRRLAEHAPIERNYWLRRMAQRGAESQKSDTRMPPAEVGGCHFQAPRPDSSSSIPRLRRLDGFERQYSRRLVGDYLGVAEMTHR